MPNEWQEIAPDPFAVQTPSAFLPLSPVPNVQNDRNPKSMVPGTEPPQEPTALPPANTVTEVADPSTWGVFLDRPGLARMIVRSCTISMRTADHWHNASEILAAADVDRRQGPEIFEDSLTIGH